MQGVPSGDDRPLIEETGIGLGAIVEQGQRHQGMPQNAAGDDEPPARADAKPWFRDGLRLWRRTVFHEAG
jgi:hypothetical protein